MRPLTLLLTLLSTTLTHASSLVKPHSCPALPKGHLSPHSTHQISYNTPWTPYAPNKFALLTPHDHCTLTTFSIPPSASGKTCTLLFSIPPLAPGKIGGCGEATYLFSGGGTFEFYAYGPGVGEGIKEKGVSYVDQAVWPGGVVKEMSVVPGKVYTVWEGACRVGKVAGRMCSRDTYLGYSLGKGKEEKGACKVGMFVGIGK
ncbi:hypothetical protein EJ06DRAFT_554231 [Trichodelitschia bisporula]|uniref:Ubiquitin 3 binding protein But2 C-terminal domain-containing protein n=1 Tax=Trichodelitschia bisporula TaxID=703511 RepID=A0A6G1I6U9_9PEZI|nr:hypothetical protein EJ06DRAFT_554231 [Trichodelitschia bisporula]